METFNQEKSKKFISNPFFRIISPLVLGLFVYFLILMVFDTIDQLETNFFRAELILCILISYLISEINRILIFILEEKLPVNIDLSKRIFIQVFLSSLLIFLVTSLAVSFYMKNLVGFKSYNSELIIFNSLYITLGWSYHAVYFSMVYLKKVADIRFENEKLRKEAVEIQMEASLNHLKPDFLNKSLETLIALTYNNPVLADDYLGKISDFYRGMLSNTKTDFINFNEELKNARNYISIYNNWNGSAIVLNESIENEASDIKILSRTIQVIFEYIVKSAILLPQVPLEITLTLEALNLEIKCKKTNRLSLSKQLENEMSNLKRSYNFYTNESIEITDYEGLFIAKIPLLLMEQNMQ